MSSSDKFAENVHLLLLNQSPDITGDVQRAVEHFGEERVTGYVQAIQDISKQITSLIFDLDRNGQTMKYKSEYTIKKNILKFLAQQENFIDIGKSSLENFASKNISQPH